MSFSVIHNFQPKRIQESVRDATLAFAIFIRKEYKNRSGARYPENELLTLFYVPRACSRQTL